MQSKVHVCIFGRVASSIILAKEYLMSALRQELSFIDNHHLRSKYFRTCDQGSEPPLDDGNESSDESAVHPTDGVIGRPSLWIAEDFWVLRFRLMVKRGPW